MFHDVYHQPPAILAYRLTYSPAYRPTGTPIDPHASRQALGERRTTTVQAPTADAAIDRFERESGCMVTECTRLQAGAGSDGE